MDIFTTAAMTGAINQLSPPESFGRQIFIKGEQTDPDNEEIHFDMLDQEPVLIPFCSPDLPAPVASESGHRTKKFKPPYMKVKRPFTPNKALIRRPGEAIGGNLTAQQRAAAALAQDLTDFRASFDRRIEWMIWQAALTGQIIVIGENYPAKTLDFGRHESLTLVEPVGMQWGDSGVDIVERIERYIELIQLHSDGVPNRIYSDLGAWQIARKSPSIQKLLETRRGSKATAEIGPVVSGPGASKARHVATLNDSGLEWWVYTADYKDPLTGEKKKHIPKNTIILADDDAMAGIAAYGMIHDEKAGYRAERFFAKSWIPDDPPVRWVMGQANAIFVPRKPNASMRVTVRTD